MNTTCVQLIDKSRKRQIKAKGEKTTITTRKSKAISDPRSQIKCSLYRKLTLNVLTAGRLTRQSKAMEARRLASHRQLQPSPSVYALIFVTIENASDRIAHISM